MKISNILDFLKRINYILVLAWVIPVGVLLLILYLNFLPFGYEKTLIIDVGTKNDDKGEFYLKKTGALGSRQELDGETFRYLDGLAYAVYEPKVVLNNATIEAELTASSGVSFILPPDLTDVKWDYDWNAENIGEYFEAEVSEKRVFEAFQATPSKEATSSNISITNEDSNESWAIEIKWQANKFAQLLTDDINLYQDQKELYLNFKGTILKYPLPDYFLGETRTAIIGFDGQKLYLTTDQNEASTKVISTVIVNKDKESNHLPSLYTSKTTSVTSLNFHTGKPQFIQTKDDSIYLDGNTRLVMPNTADQFEDGPFTVYAEWTPEKDENGQQIIGHYNWEIWQNEKSVSFNVGRMSTSTGPFYKITHKINENFFDKPHTLLATYNPISASTTNGYIELFIDSIFAGREYFADETIWQDYSTRSLSLGNTSHNSSKNSKFQGKINKIKINFINIKTRKSDIINILKNEDIINFSIYGTGKFNFIKIKIKK